MSPPLPLEVLDHIFDDLFQEKETLKTCCVLSKSWVPYVRRHLFHTIKFNSHIKPPIELWTNAFPDPSNSPAHHTRALTLEGLPTVAAAVTHSHAYIRTFRYILELKLASMTHEGPVQFSLVPLHGFSPNLKSLSLNLPAPSQELLDLVCSFPSLENLDLDVRSTNDGTIADEWKAPSNSPTLAGSLELHGKICSIARKLLDLPNGLHPVQIRMVCDAELASLMNDLLLKCSDTLESLYIGFRSRSGVYSSAFIVDQHLTATHVPRHSATV